MRIDGKSTRVRERTKLRIPLVVRYQETGERVWEEKTELRDVTPFGAGFYLRRPLEPQRLVYLSMPLPNKFRFYDFNHSLYGIWGVVRYVLAGPPDEDSLTTFSIGVAFIGREVPDSYRLDPTTRYDLRPTLARGGAWVARAQPRRAGKFKRSEEKRYAHAFPVAVEVFDDTGRVTAAAIAETENVSRHGAAVAQEIDLPRGSFVRLTSSTFGVSVLAIVRANRIAADGRRSLHLEFVDGEWPVAQSD